MEKQIKKKKKNKFEYIQIKNVAHPETLKSKLNKPVVEKIAKQQGTR